MVTASIRIDPDVDAPDLFPAHDPNALLSPEQLAELTGEPDCPIVTISYQDIQSEEQPQELGAESWTRSSISSTGDYTSGVGGCALPGAEAAGAMGPPGGGAPQPAGSAFASSEGQQPHGVAQPPWASGRAAPGVAHLPPLFEGSGDQSSAVPSQLSNGAAIDSMHVPAGATDTSRASEDAHEVLPGDMPPVSGVAARQVHPSWLEDDEALPAEVAVAVAPGSRQHSGGSDARAQMRQSSADQVGAWPHGHDTFTPALERQASAERREMRTLAAHQPVPLAPSEERRTEDGQQPRAREPDVYPPPAALARLQAPAVAPASAGSQEWPPEGAAGGATELFDAHGAGGDYGQWAPPTPGALPTAGYVPAGPISEYAAVDHGAHSAAEVQQRSPLPQRWPSGHPAEHQDMQPLSTVSTTLHPSGAVDTLELRAGFTNEALRTQHSAAAAAPAAMRSVGEHSYADTPTRYDVAAARVSRDAAADTGQAEVPYFHATVCETSEGNLSLDAGSAQAASGTVTSDSGAVAPTAMEPSTTARGERSGVAQRKASGNADGGTPLCATTPASSRQGSAVLAGGNAPPQQPPAAASALAAEALPGEGVADDAYVLEQLEREYERHKAALSTEEILAEMMREQSEQDTARMSRQLRTERLQGAGSRPVQGSMSEDEWSRVLQEDAMRRSAQQSWLS